MPYVDELSDVEAAAIGVARTRLAAASAAELPVEHVHAMVAGSVSRTSTSTCSYDTWVPHLMSRGTSPGPTRRWGTSQRWWIGSQAD